MSSPIELSTLISVVRTAINKAETVTSNREIFVRQTNKLRLALFLQDIQPNYRLKNEQHKTINGLCKDLYDVTHRIDGTGTGLDFGPAGLPFDRSDRETGRLPFEQSFAV